MTTSQTSRSLGTIESSELLLRELYVDLRRRVRLWSSTTRQTPQARMGYVGQHLTSVATGYPGGRSGARGYDLVLPGGKHSEIKTCYRVDQLGACAICKVPVSSVESVCPSCGSNQIVRKDDSKWLIGIRNDDEMKGLFDPESYYLVLFDFSAEEEVAQASAAGEESTVAVVTDRPLDVNARIWQVDPQHPGFAMCMVDYRYNIKARSKSGAPFNLWPYSLKFQLMSPKLIYHAVIRADDTIHTLVFPGQRGDAVNYPIMPFPKMRGSRKNLDDQKLLRFAKEQNIPMPPGTNRVRTLETLERARHEKGWLDSWLAYQLAILMYREGIESQESWLPAALRKA